MTRWIEVGAWQEEGYRMMPFRFFGWVSWYMVMPLTETGKVKQGEHMLPGTPGTQK